MKKFLVIMLSVFMLAGVALTQRVISAQAKDDHHEEPRCEERQVSQEGLCQVNLAPKCEKCWTEKENYDCHGHRGHWECKTRDKKVCDSRCSFCSDRPADTWITRSSSRDNWSLGRCEGPENNICKNIVGHPTMTDGMIISDKGICSCKDGYHKVTSNSEDLKMMRREEEDPFTCVSDEPTPTPTPSTDEGRVSGSWIQTNCDGHIDARMNLYESGKGIEKVTVTFKYMNETKTVMTNSNGEANVGFDFRGEDKVFMSADGWSGQEPTAKAPTTSCSTTGQVLGATTMAGTGMFDTSIMNLFGVAGSLLTIVGLRRYGKKN